MRDLYRFLLIFPILIDFGRFPFKTDISYMKNGQGMSRIYLEVVSDSDSTSKGPF